ncbi:hypothetical protein L6452_42736 [Arctium lappa]|uniref:Uncharacterized protein n=1 Tax=Arctium lappa TaxID=4217 RepID=A0ACB8XK96_ARCLA|nr:hypothetical protein L6452_42736 [Arctium lappa]
MITQLNHPAFNEFICVFSKLTSNPSNHVLLKRKVQLWLKLLMRQQLQLQLSRHREVDHHHHDRRWRCTPDDICRGNGDQLRCRGWKRVQVWRQLQVRSLQLLSDEWQNDPNKGSLCV